MRKLSALEHMIDGNIVYAVCLEGDLSLDRLRSALKRVQRKHPALRAVIRVRRDGLYYEDDSAVEIPLRVVARTSQYDSVRERDVELKTILSYDQPQLRVVCLYSELESDLLFTTSHRICDGMSLMTVVREVLRALYSDQELLPYVPVTARNLIGNYQPPVLWKHKLKVGLLNGLVRLIPPSNRMSDKSTCFLEWDSEPELLTELKRCCKSEGVSIHAALATALECALFAVLGPGKMPRWIGHSVDLRRGRFSALKEDMLFFTSGGFKIATEKAQDKSFWKRARAVHKEVQEKVEEELQLIPARFHLFEALRPPSAARGRSIMRILTALKPNLTQSCFGISNLGNIELLDSNAPFRVKDLRIHVHSFKTKLLGLVTYTVNGRLRCYCVSDEQFLNLSQIEAIRLEFAAILERQVLERNSQDHSVSQAEFADHYAHSATR